MIHWKTRTRVVHTCSWQYAVVYTEDMLPLHTVYGACKAEATHVVTSTWFSHARLERTTLYFCSAHARLFVQPSYTVQPI